jgi:hypothetical protein
MRISLPVSSNWPTSTGYGASTAGSWGHVTIDGSTYARTATNPDGTSGSLNWTIVPTSLPPGLRSATSGSGNYFLAQGAKLSTLIGARSNPNTEGYISFALSD